MEKFTKVIVATAVEPKKLVLCNSCDRYLSSLPSGSQHSGTLASPSRTVRQLAPTLVRACNRKRFYHAS